MIGIINYGHGNIGSIENALSKINSKYSVVTNPENLLELVDRQLTNNIIHNINNDILVKKFK